MSPKRSLVILALVAAIVAVPVRGASAGSTSTFTFYGGGFGHGVGMSQWGAFGLAQEGWDHSKILTRYFSGTSIGKATNEPERIRVGLTDGRQWVHLAAKSGPVELRAGGPGNDGTLVTTIPGGQTDLVKGGTGNWKIVDGTGKQVGSADGSNKLFAVYQDAGSMVTSAEAGHTYNRGFIEMNIYKPCASCSPKVRMIAVVTPGAYLYGLGEVPASWPVEAMKAQADAARSYAYYLIAALGQNRAVCNCGVYDDTRNQVYSAWDHEGENGGERWVQAVDGTGGEVVLYEGKVIDAQYMSSSGGFTENNENVWGGSPLPYLRGVCDPGDFTDANNARAWSVSLSVDTVTARLRPYTGDIGAVESFEGIARGVSGRIIKLKVMGDSGSKLVYGTTLRGALGLLDDRLWINSNRLVVGNIRQKYDALDCAPGLAQGPEVGVPGGVKQRFHDGAIYRNVGAARVVWLHGPIYNEYVSVHEAMGPLGLPASKINELSTPTGCDQQACSKARFDHGFVFFKGDTGAHELHGAVLDYFLAQDGVFGHLGFPTTDVRSGGAGSKQATFQGKAGQSPVVVTCDNSGSCQESTPSN